MVKLDKRFFAILISRLFGPTVELFLLFWLMLFKTELTVEQLKILIPLTFILELVLPVLILFYLWEKKKITDLDMTRRQERPLFFGLVLACYLLSVLMIGIWGNGLFFWLKVSVLIIMGIGSLITTRWKISVHLAAGAMTVILFTVLLSQYCLILGLLLLPVAWARYVLHKHTPAQMIAGTLLSCLILIPLWWLL